jgi:UDP-N-acetylmuramoyl-L-alanyl-D-glutamate--2,6-diaminopimelate ligase
LPSRTNLSQLDEEVRSISASSRDVQSHGAGARVVARKTLTDVLHGVDTAAVPTGNPEILQVACDSRKVKPGGLFFALQGAKENGGAFVQDAIARGAVAIAREEVSPVGSPGTNVTAVQVRESRKALAIAASNFFDHPAKSLQLVGVTGTNGKTTTTSVIDAIIKASKAKTGLFGTIAYETPVGKYPAPNTTPESVDLQGFLAEIRDAGGRYATLEASSHSLTMERLWGCHFSAAVFTNLTREHMDYHKTFEDYFAAKKTLFTGMGAGVPDTAIINIDDQYGRQLLGLAKKTVTYGLDASADITTKKFQLSFNGLTFAAQTPQGKLQITSNLVGRINVYNILAAIGAAQALGISNDAITAGISNLESVSGRFQRIDQGQPFLLIVD